LRLNLVEREALARLAEKEGLSEAATLRRLLRQAINQQPDFQTPEVVQPRHVSNTHRA